LVFCASSQAISAEIIGLRAKAMAMPVEKCRSGAAIDAAAMFIHGTWWPSVNSMPEKPAASTRRARPATLSHVVARVMTSNSMPSILACFTQDRQRRALLHQKLASQGDGRGTNADEGHQRHQGKIDQAVTLTMGHCSTGYTAFVKVRFVACRDNETRPPRYR
jgi:hypothetical protein